MAEQEVPRRPGMGDVALTLAQQTRRGVEPHYSVEITRSTTTGRYGFKVGCDDASPDGVLEAALDLVAKLRVEFPDVESKS